MNANQLLGRLRNLDTKYNSRSIGIDDCILELMLIREEAGKMNGVSFIEPDYFTARDLYTSLIVNIEKETSSFLDIPRII